MVIGTDLDALTARVAALDGGTASYSFAERFPICAADSDTLAGLGADLDTLAARAAALPLVRSKPTLAFNAAANSQYLGMI